MKGITIGTLHTWRDLKLILAKKTIGTPAPKTELIDIPGGDGVLDLTEFFGDVKYHNRPISYEFSTVIPPPEFPALFSRVQNAYHGQKLQIVDDDDPAHYYMGRITVSEWKADRTIGKLTIDCDCEPYLYKLGKTTVSKTIDGTEAIPLTNGRKRAVPQVVIKTDSSMNLVYQGVNVWDLGSGTYTLPELELVEGVNTVTVTGTGTITFTWQEGGL